MVVTRPEKRVLSQGQQCTYVVPTTERAPDPSALSRTSPEGPASWAFRDLLSLLFYGDLRAGAISQ